MCSSKFAFGVYMYIESGLIKYTRGY